MINKPVILVVDDSDQNRDAICMLLSHEGYEVHSANSAANALAVIERIVPHI